MKTGAKIKKRITDLLFKLGILVVAAAPMKTASAKTNSPAPKISPRSEDINIVETPKDPFNQPQPETLSSAEVKTKINDLLEKKEQLRQDSLEQAEQKNLDATGYDIHYRANGDRFVVTTANGGGFVITDKAMNYNKIAESYLAQQKEIFSKPTQYITDTISIAQMCADNVSENGVSFTSGEFNNEENTIRMYRVTLEGKEAVVDSIMKVLKYPQQRAERLVMEIYNEVNNPEFNASNLDHEESHLSDYENNFFIPNLPTKYMNALSCLTEIKASMTQAGRALEQFEKDHNPAHFAPVNLNVDTLQLQKQLSAEKDVSKHKEIVGSYIFQNWLDTYNREDAWYSLHIANSIMFQPRDAETLFLQKNIQDTPDAHQEYLRRVNKMFSDVKYLGDMRAVINPDFELNPQMQKSYKSSFAPLTQNSLNTAEAYQRIAGLLTVVRDCDADGVRTQQEQDLINNTIIELRQKAQDSNILSQQTPLRQKTVEY